MTADSSKLHAGQLVPQRFQNAGNAFFGRQSGKLLLDGLEKGGSSRAMFLCQLFKVVGMGELNGHTRDQHLVVVFTKADQLVARFTGRWKPLYTYLVNGAVEALADADGYMEELAHISNQLRQFTEHDLQAHEFINTAESNFKSVSFCIISALGTQPDGARLSVEIIPRRILDPVLWVMERSFAGWGRSFRRWLEDVVSR